MKVLYKKQNQALLRIEIKNTFLMRRICVIVLKQLLI